MRNLQTSDIFAFVRMIDEVGIKDKLKELVLSKNNISDLTAESFGYDIIFTLLEGASQKKAEQAIYEFFGNLFELTPEEVSKLDAVDFLEKVTQVADVEKWQSFFSSVARLMKQN